MRSQPTATVTGRVAGAGVLSQCSMPGVSVRRNGAGDFRLRFPVGVRLIGITATPGYAAGAPITANINPGTDPNELTVSILAGVAGTDAAVWSFVAAVAA